MFFVVFLRDDFVLPLDLFAGLKGEELFDIGKITTVLGDKLSEEGIFLLTPFLMIGGGMGF